MYYVKIYVGDSDADYMFYMVECSADEIEKFCQCKARENSYDYIEFNDSQGEIQCVGQTILEFFNIRLEYVEHWEVLDIINSSSP